MVLVWARASLTVCAPLCPHEMPSRQSFLQQVFSFDIREFLIACCCVGDFFAVLVFAISVVSVPIRGTLEGSRAAVRVVLQRGLQRRQAVLAGWSHGFVRHIWRNN